MFLFQSRREIFEANYDFIEKHNAASANGEHSFTLGINQLADMTNEEINKLMNGYNASASVQGEIDDFSNVQDVPNEVDWVNEVR